jgi:hypothetical protein
VPRGEVGELRVREYAGWCIIEMALVSESSTLMCSSVDVLVASSMLRETSAGLYPFLLYASATLAPMLDLQPKMRSIGSEVMIGE